MNIEFIDIIETNPSNPEWPRQSCFSLTDREPNSLRVVGVLPHGYEWRPRTSQARHELIAWLSSLEYKS